MMLKKLRTVVYHVDDLQKAKTWYSETFGVQPYFDEPFYVGFDIGGCELGLHPLENDTVAGSAAITYWLVDDVQAVFAHIKSKSGQVHEAVSEVGGGILTASISDPFGNIIGLISIPGE